MKKNTFIAASVAALAFTACTENEYIGEVNDPQGKFAEITFTSKSGAVTRAEKTGADAATLLGKNFVVEGTKGALPESTPTTNVVFDNYIVKYTENTAGTTESNTANWEYVNQTHDAIGTNAANTIGRTATEQSIKYWDFSQPEYDFIAYSTGASTMVAGTDVTSSTLTDGQVKVTKIATGTGLASDAYSFEALSTTDLANCYITDVTPVLPTNYGKTVKLTFKNLTAKIRLGIYETIPGYSVKNVEFYADNSALKSFVAKTGLTDGADLSGLYYMDGGVYKKATGTYSGSGTYYELKDGTAPSASATATLFTTGGDVIPNSGKITVKYPKTGTTNASNTAEYNKATISVVNGSVTTTKVLFGAFPSTVIGTNLPAATFAAGTTDNHYNAVMPNSSGKALTLRVNYTLVSTDGNGEEIKIWGARAVVPPTYTNWQPNYAYTYIFKISDNTNGNSGGLLPIDPTTPVDPDDPTIPTTPEGLFPITFDAVVADVENFDGQQTTITTVATPSITTYQKGHVISDGTATTEYTAAKGDIYVQVMNNNVAPSVPYTDLDSKGKLYTITGSTEITEATVMDALIKQTAENTGRNGLTLTAGPSVAYPTAVPGPDGKNVTVAEKTVAQFTPTPSKTYAYVYTIAAKNDSNNKDKYESVPLDSEPTGFPTGYYTTTDGSTFTEATSPWDSATTYYVKYTENDGKYAVKVIKVQ
ncbi:MAG: hypothetical protein MJZ36_00865 [Bacteroidaceae bacterium]|nr:hypothetical protein [Bacteroidaceae bacterium]